MTSPNALDQISFAELLSPEERAELAESLQLVPFTAGTMIVRSDEPGDSLFVVHSGRVECFLTDDIGQRLVLETLEAGGVFGELALLDGGARSASVAAVEDCQLLRLDRHALGSWLQKRPDAVARMLTTMGRRLRQSTEKLRRGPRNANQVVNQESSAIDKFADKVVEFTGSFTCLLIHLAIIGGWILLNTGLFFPALDPFPFGLLTMLLSIEAIVLTVLVLISQNRGAAQDRLRSDVEYEVNVRAELEITQLHAKFDQLTRTLLNRLDAIDRSAKWNSGERPAIDGGNGDSRKPS